MQHISTDKLYLIKTRTVFQESLLLTVAVRLLQFGLPSAMASASENGLYNWSTHSMKSTSMIPDELLSQHSNRSSILLSRCLCFASSWSCKTWSDDFIKLATSKTVSLNHLSGVCLSVCFSHLISPDPCTDLSAVAPDWTNVHSVQGTMHLLVYSIMHKPHTCNILPQAIFQVTLVASFTCSET